MKDIVIICHFSRDFSQTDNGRFMYLCKELSKDNQVEIITSDYAHMTKKHKEPLVHNWPFTITFLHEPGYRKNISLQRFTSHKSWGREVGKYLYRRKKPDVIYCAVPSLTAPYEAAKYCQKNGVRFIIDIQDLWPEAFQVVFKIPVISSAVFAPFRHRADEIYKRADVVCGVSETYVDRALQVNRKVKRGRVVFLGTNLQTFDANAANNHVEKPKDELWLGYCGSLNTSYDLTVVFDALLILKLRNKIVPKFIIMGTGEKMGAFRDYAAQLGLNCLFTGQLPYDQMCGRLSACDIAVNPIAHNASQSIINKHGDYASAGLPILNTQESAEYRRLVDEYQMGFNCENGNPEDLADKLERLVNDEALRNRMSKCARICAEERFDRRHTYQKLVKTVLDQDAEE